jgi:hypothetical protein
MRTIMKALDRLAVMVATTMLLVALFGNYVPQNSSHKRDSLVDSLILVSFKEGAMYYRTAVFCARPKASLRVEDSVFNELLVADTILPVIIRRSAYMPQHYRTQ